MRDYPTLTCVNSRLLPGIDSQIKCAGCSAIYILNCVQQRGNYETNYKTTDCIRLNDKLKTLTSRKMGIVNKVLNANASKTTNSNTS